MEPDISILRKTGHFYFALTRGGKYVEGSTWRRENTWREVLSASISLIGCEHVLSAAPERQGRSSRVRLSRWLSGGPFHVFTA